MFLCGFYYFVDNIGKMLYYIYRNIIADKNIIQEIIKYYFSQSNLQPLSVLRLTTQSTSPEVRGMVSPLRKFFSSYAMSHQSKLTNSNTVYFHPTFHPYRSSYR